MEGGHVDIGSYLIKHGISMNSAHFRLAIEKKSYQFLELFLDHGFNINKSQGDLDPAPLANVFDDERMTLWFLDHDADPNAETRMGITPLSKALFRVPFHIVRLLFDRGGPHSVNCGYSLHHAIHRETPGRLRVLDYLLTQGASSNINQLIYHDRQSLSEEENLILGCGTPLHKASRHEKLDVVKLFVSRGADPLILDGKGRLAIDAARTSCHSDVVEYLASCSVSTFQ